LLIFERHTGCLLAARLRPGRVVALAPAVPFYGDCGGRGSVPVSAT